MLIGVNLLRDALDGEISQPLRLTRADLRAAGERRR
jgi:hypothetical protein